MTTSHSLREPVSTKVTFAAAGLGIRRITTFRAWFPTIPFISYWVTSLLFYEFGPLVNPRLRPQTYLYLAVSLAVFLVGYHLALHRKRESNVLVLRGEIRRAVRWVQWTSVFALIGELGLVADRLLSGAGSISRSLYETEYVRTEFVRNTTWLTTISVLPYALSLISIAGYFYCLGTRQRVSRWVHAVIFLQMALDVLNAFLSVNRGPVYYLLTYWLICCFFAMGISVRDAVWSARYRLARLGFVLFLVLACTYIYFIARNRNSGEYLEAMANNVTTTGRYDFLRTRDRDFGALMSLVFYGTHEFEFIDAFVERADWVSFHPTFLVGGRFIDQIQRAYPNFTPKEWEIAADWVADAGLPPSAWPSVFGWPLVMFGSLGAIVFFFGLGSLFGGMTGRYLARGEFGALVGVFCLYAALNMSFNWIGGDFTHNAGYLAAIWLIATAERAPTPVRRLLSPLSDADKA